MTSTLKPISQYKIALADDDLLMRNVMSTILRDICFVDVITDTTKVIDYFSSSAPPDLLILDIHLSRCCGIEVCKQIRQMNKFKNLPIIFVTANIDTASENKCWQAGCDDFIFKPITPSIFRQRIVKHLLMQARLKQLDELTGSLLNDKHALRGELSWRGTS